MNKKTKLNTDELGKLPPQAIELEEAILGAIMTQKQAFSVISTILDSSDFYSEEHILIYGAMCIIFKKGIAIDVLSVNTQLRSENNLEKAGGVYKIAQLSSKGSLINLEHNARVIAEKSMLRKQISICHQFISSCYDADADPFELLSSQKTMLSSVERSDNTDMSPFQRMKETQDSIYKAMENDGVTGVPLGIKKLTNFLGGAQEGDYIVFAARSGAFKSAIMLWIQHHLNLLDIPSLMFQQEMTNVQTGVREIAMKTGLLTQDVKRGKLTDTDWIKVHKAIGAIAESKVFIDTTPNQKIGTIKSKIQRAIDEHGIKVAVIDYLHLCDLEVKKHGNEEQAIAQHCKEMKSIAKELKISIIELAQFNKEATKDELKPPHMGLLKGSGAIEFSADAVIFLWNPAKIDETFEWDGVQTKGKIAVIVAKNKNGATGMFWHGVKAESNQFFELEDNDYSANKHIEPNVNFENSTDAPF
jgi:replicative DNA helicase